MEEIFFGIHLGSVIHWEKALGICPVLLLFHVHPLPVICTICFGFGVISKRSNNFLKHLWDNVNLSSQFKIKCRMKPICPRSPKLKSGKKNPLISTCTRIFAHYQCFTLHMASDVFLPPTFKV